jgi:hypothetical protein
MAALFIMYKEDSRNQTLERLHERRKQAMAQKSAWMNT